MPSPEALAINQLLRQFRAEAAAAGELTLEELRERSKSFGDMCTTPAGVTWESVDAGGIPAIWAIPAGGSPDRAIQYVHGGGYVLGSAEVHKNLTGHLAQSVGCRVLNVDYGLAPENPHPGPVNDSVQAYRWLLDQGLAPEHLAISGDSAGGGLTLTTVLKLRQDGVPQPAAAVPISPWTDMEGSGESMSSNADRDLLIERQGLKGMVDMFVAGGDPRDPLASPLYGDYHGICPLYFQVGGDETLLDDALRVADRAREAGVDVEIDVFPDMQHVFQMAAGNMPEADEAVARIGTYLRPRLGLV